MTSRALGAVLCAAGALGGALLAATLWLGPSQAALVPLPLRSLYVVAFASALLAAAGLYLRDRTRRALPIFLVAFAAPLANTRLMSSGDNHATAALPFQLLRHGSLTFDPAEPHGYARVPAKDGRMASRYPMGTALLALPLMALPALGPGGAREALISPVEKLAAAALAALALLFSYLTLRALAGERLALLAAALALFGTSWLPVLGQGLWQHTGAALSLAFGAWALFARPQTARSAMLVGLGAGMALVCRPPDLPLAASLLAALLLVDLPLRFSHGLRRALPAALGAALPILLDMAYRTALFGGPFATGYGSEASQGWRPVWPDGAVGFAGLLVSPARGIFLWSPVLLAAWLALLWPAKLDPRRRALRALGVGALAHAMLMACWWCWDGSWSAAPRMLSDALPLFTLGLPRALDWLRQTRRRRAALGVAAAWSVACCALAAYAPAGPYVLAHVYESSSETAWRVSRHPLIAWPCEWRSHSSARAAAH